MRDFKSEIADVLVSNRQLARELEYDLRIAEGRPSSAKASPALSSTGTSSRKRRSSAGKRKSSIGTPPLLSASAMRAAPGSGRKTPLSAPRLSASSANRGGPVSRAAAAGMSPALINFPTKASASAAAAEGAENEGPEVAGRAAKRQRRGVGAA